MATNDLPPSHVLALLEAQARAMRKEIEFLTLAHRPEAKEWETWCTRWLARAYTNNWVLELPTR